MACPACGCPISEIKVAIEAEEKARIEAREAIAKLPTIRREFKGYRGGKVLIDGDNISVYNKTILGKKEFSFSDIASIIFKEPVALITNGSVKFILHNPQASPYEVVFLKKDRSTFIELYDIVAVRIGVPIFADQFAENQKAEQEKIAKEKERIARMAAEGVAYCPRCYSTSLSSNKKGFGIGKAIIGAAAVGGIGLIAGNIGAKKVRITCMNCGHEFWAGRR